MEQHDDGRPLRKLSDDCDQKCAGNGRHPNSATVERTVGVTVRNRGDRDVLTERLIYIGSLGSCRSTIELHPRGGRFYVGCPQYST